MKAGAVIAGKYRLTRPIGVGAMGTVWEATHEGTSRQVAVKLILEPTEELRRRLVREARAYGSLRHRNIVEVLDVGQTDEGDPFLVMQLLVGETLADRLVRQRRLGVPEATRIARDIARALAAAHAASIIHRDLKPANIFLHDEPGEDTTVIKVVDFGVSKNLLASDGLTTVAGGMVGSPAYMSPEQAAAGACGPVDHRADLWSLGVVLFEMLTGVRPLQGDANTILPRILSAEIPLVTSFVRTVDPRLAALVARCLDRDLAKRAGSAADLALQLQIFTAVGSGAGASSPAKEGSGSSVPLAPPPRGTREEDEDAPTEKLSRDGLHALGPTAQAAPRSMPLRAGRTVPMQSDPAPAPPHSAAPPSQSEAAPAPPRSKATSSIQHDPLFTSAVTWPAPPPTTAKLPPSSSWAAEPMAMNQGTILILPGAAAGLGKLVAATSPLGPPPAPPPPPAAKGLSLISSTAPLMQPSGGDLSSAGQPLGVQRKRRRASLFVAGSVAGVALAALVVGAIRPKLEVEPASSAPRPPATAMASVAPADSASAQEVVPPLPLASTRVGPVPPVAPSVSAKARPPLPKLPVVGPASITPPAQPPRSTSRLPGFLGGPRKASSSVP
jgi:serine/threonine-protein kinase